MITVASAQANCGEKIVTRRNSGFDMRISYSKGGDVHLVGTNKNNFVSEKKQANVEKQQKSILFSNIH